MSEDSELWQAYREEQKQRRSERLPIRQEEIESLSEKGYEVKRLTAYQYRIDGRIDLYPIHNRWHDLKTGRRGGHKHLPTFIMNTMPRPQDE